MGDLIDINEWIEQRVNSLAQAFRSCCDTQHSKKLESVLKEWGHKMARYKMHYVRNRRAKERKDEEI